MHPQNICIYEKFSTCKMGDRCNFHHPTLVCDDKECDIKLCLKRHPETCLYDTVFHACRNEDHCRYQHRKIDFPTDFNEDKYRELEEKYNAILEDYKIVLRRIEALESNNKKQNNEISKVESQRSLGDMKRKIDSQEKDDDLFVTSKKNKIDKDTLVSDDTQEDEMVVDVLDEEKSSKIREFQHYRTLWTDTLKELVKIKNYIKKEKMYAKSVNKAKEMIRTLETGTPPLSDQDKTNKEMGKRANVWLDLFEAMYKRVNETNGSKFKQIAIMELDKMIKITKKQKDLVVSKLTKIETVQKQNEN